MGMKMYKWTMMIWIKDKTAWGSYGSRKYIYAYNENLQGITTWSNSIPIAWLLNLKRNMYIDQMWKHITRVIRMYILYIFDMLHMIQKPLARMDFTCRSLPHNYQFITSDCTVRIFYISRKVIPELRTLISKTIYSKANCIYFWLNQYRPTTCIVKCGKGEERDHIFRI